MEKGRRVTQVGGRAYNGPVGTGYKEAADARYDCGDHGADQAQHCGVAHADGLCAS